MAESSDASPIDPEEFKKLRSPEEFGRKTALSTAFVRLVIECGCPTKDGNLSHGMFTAWLAENFGLVRAAAGLPPLPSPDTATNTKERAELCVDGYLRTIMDFAVSRCSNLEIKEAYTAIRKCMDERRENDQ